MAMKPTPSLSNKKDRTNRIECKVRVARSDLSLLLSEENKEEQEKRRA